MKKLSSFILIALLLICLPNSLSADIGVKLGPQRSDFDSGGLDMSRFKFGIFYSIKLNDKISLQPEIYYSQMGINSFDVYYPNGYPEDPDKFVCQYKDTLSYMEVPLIIKYSLKPIGDLRPIILGGGYAAVRVSKNLSFPQDEVDWASSYEDSIYWQGYWDAERFNAPRPLTADDVYLPHAAIDAGIILGLGLEHGRDKIKMSFDMRFNIGMTNMHRESTLHLKKRNNSMSFLLGLSF